MMKMMWEEIVMSCIHYFDIFSTLVFPSNVLPVFFGVDSVVCFCLQTVKFVKLFRHVLSYVANRVAQRRILLLEEKEDYLSSIYLAVLIQACHCMGCDVWLFTYRHVIASRLWQKVLLLFYKTHLIANLYAHISNIAFYVVQLARHCKLTYHQPSNFKYWNFKYKHLLEGVTY